MNSFIDALRALGELKGTGVVEDYAVAGAMALVFWTEPIPTYDLDVLVFLPEQERPITSLEGIYSWAAAHGYPVESEHVLVEGVPVQFLPSHNELADEAIETAQTLDYEGVPVRVVRPEYLIALYLEPAARTMKRRERAAALAEAPATNQQALRALLERFKVSS
ncbi:MAG TPA: hypothetical protein VHR45_14270 [Thermoanaerobaculia bacterium]|nr:hypothetical protein [Thermoanaerobaculia bacterium]